MNKQIVGILAIDVVGFSRLGDDAQRSYVTHVLPKIASRLRDPNYSLLQVISTGDGFFAIADNVLSVARAALDIRDLFRSEDWEGLGFPARLSCRIALHAGPVFLEEDAARRTVNAIGTEVNRAARIEAVCPPGQVYASNPFVTLAGGEPTIVFDRVADVIPLKGFGAVELYRVRRASEAPEPTDIPAERRRSTLEPKQSRASQEVHPPTVLIVHSSAEAAFAHNIVRLLRSRASSLPVEDIELGTDDSFAQTVLRPATGGRYIVILVSPATAQATWARQELSEPVATDIEAKGGVLLPAWMADCDLPSPLAKRLWLDLREGTDTGTTRVLDSLASVPGLDFSRLEPHDFQRLATDLLRALRFRLRLDAPSTLDYGIDLDAEIQTQDPFGAIQTERWLVELKLYRAERADLSTLDQLSRLGSISAKPIRLLLITNGILTSAARSWLSEERAASRAHLRVIEGPELRRLILTHLIPLPEYFGSKAAR